MWVTYKEKVEITIIKRGRCRRVGSSLAKIAKGNS